MIWSIKFHLSSIK